MARKPGSNNPDNSGERGRNDIAGVVVFALAVLVLIALFTYDRNDLGINTTAGNQCSSYSAQLLICCQSCCSF
jgi:hypothetical protein